MIHYFWLIVISLLLLVFIVIPATVIWQLSMRIPEDAGRRRFLKKALIYPVGLAAATGYGCGYEREKIIRNYPLGKLMQYPLSWKNRRM